MSTLSMSNSEGGYKPTTQKEDDSVKRLVGGDHITNNPFSKLTWWWVGQYVQACYNNKSITDAELPLTPKFCQADNLRKTFAGHFFENGEHGKQK